MLEESPDETRRKWQTLRLTVTPIIHERDGAHCRRCGAMEHLQIDHILPITRGGGNEFDNLQVLCRSCNTRKGNSRDGDKRMARRSPQNPDEINIREAAELLGVSREKVRRMIKAGLLTARTSTLDQRERRIPRSDVERILAEEQAARPE